MAGIFPAIFLLIPPLKGEGPARSVGGGVIALRYANPHANPHPARSRSPPSHCGGGIKSAIQIFKQPLANASPPVFFAAPGNAVFLFSSPSEKSRGWSTEWRTGSFRLAAFPFGERGRLSALHRGFSVPGTVTSVCAAGSSSLPRSGGFRRLRRHPCSHSRQPPVVGADGDPRPPGCGGTFVPARGRHILLHHHDAS